MKSFEDDIGHREIDPGQVFLDLWQPIPEGLPALIRQPEIVGFGVLPAVEGGQLSAAGCLPLKEAGARFGRAAKVVVDRHAEALNPQVEQDIREPPILPIHIAIHRRTDIHPKFPAQMFNWFE